MVGTRGKGGKFGYYIGLMSGARRQHCSIKQQLLLKAREQALVRDAGPPRKADP
jgi:hypothetical protein